MAAILPIEKFLPLANTLPLVDVRSPAEFAQGHIPGAVNIPLFDNEERAIVGIGYKKGGKEHAVQLGLEIVGPKLADFVKRAKRLAPKKEILIHCWRGGMRSGSMAWLFETAGMKAYTLEGGYKAYRRYIRGQFARPVKMVVLGGFTGSGKTDILKELKKQGEQFLDIEDIAHHKGSVFGPLGQEPQPTNEQFENNLADAWQKFDFEKRLWVEDESRQLGKCVLPDSLFSRLQKAPLIKILVPKAEREKRLVNEYGGFKKEALAEQLMKIRERLGGQYLKEALLELENGNLQAVAELSLRYYDKAYAHGTLQQRPQEKVFDLTVEKDHPEKNARMILEFVKKEGSHLI